MTPLEFSNHVGTHVGTMDGSHICQCGKRHIIGEGGFGVGPASPPAGAPTPSVAPSCTATTHWFGQHDSPRCFCGATEQSDYVGMVTPNDDAFPEQNMEALAVKFSDGEIPFAPQSNNDRIAAFLRQAIRANRAQAELVCALRTRLREHNIDP